MKLYNADLSPFTGRVRLQIRAKGLENEIQIVPRPESDAYKIISPTGKIPCLDTGLGFHLPESETICEFIEDSFPEPSLRGAGALGKAKVRLFARFVDLYLLAGMNLLFGQFTANPRDTAKVEEGMKQIDEGLRLIEMYLPDGPYAAENRLTLADCALAPALFFCTNTPSVFGQSPFLGHDKAKAYYERLNAENAHCARMIEEMTAAVQAFIAQQRAA
jgi:glutathione S-transferase